MMFNQTSAKNRRNGACGGRAFARNLRLRNLLAPSAPVPERPSATKGNGPRGQFAARSSVSSARRRFQTPPLVSPRASICPNTAADKAGPA